MLEFDGVGAWLPGQGVVLDDVQFAPKSGEIWAVVGRSGAGASTLLRAASNRLPHGALLRGHIRRRGSIVHVGELPPVGVADYLGAFARYGAERHLHHRTTSVPPDVRAGLLLAALHQATPADTVLVDAQLTAAPARIRQDFADEIARRAERGATVCWADHDLPTLLAHASHVLELGHGQVLAACPVDEWVPATLPDPRITPDDVPRRRAFRGRASSNPPRSASPATPSTSLPASASASCAAMPGQNRWRAASSNTSAATCWVPVHRSAPRRSTPSFPSGSLTCRLASTPSRAAR